MTGDPWRPDTGSGAEPRAEEYAADDAWNAQQPTQVWGGPQQQGQQEFEQRHDYARPEPAPARPPSHSGGWQAQPTQYISPQQQEPTQFIAGGQPTQYLAPQQPSQPPSAAQATQFISPQPPGAAQPTQFISPQQQEPTQYLPPQQAQPTQAVPGTQPTQLIPPQSPAPNPMPANSSIPMPANSWGTPAGYAPTSIMPPVPADPRDEYGVPAAAQYPPPGRQSAQPQGPYAQNPYTAAAGQPPLPPLRPDRASDDDEYDGYGGDYGDPDERPARDGNAFLPPFVRAHPAEIGLAAAAVVVVGLVAGLLTLGGNSGSAAAASAGTTPTTQTSAGAAASAASSPSSDTITLPSASASASPSASPTPSATPSSTQTLAVGTAGVLTNEASGLCLASSDPSFSNGAATEADQCDGTDAAQQWTLTSGGEITINNGADCLDDYGFGTTAGTEVDVWTCNNGTNQQWTVGSDGMIASKSSGLCVDLAGGSTSAGTQVVLENCGSDTTQAWD